MSERQVVVRAGSSAGWRLRLMQGFELIHDGLPVALPLTAQRVLAFLAIAGQPLRREFVAGILWPDSSEAHAHGSLRSALWRLHRVAPGVLSTAGPRLALAAHVRVDYNESIERAHLLIDPRASAGVVGSLNDATRFSLELLPDWYDEWLVAERERLRQLQLHALEQMSTRLRRRQSYGQAVEAAQLAVEFEPTRESARRVLIEAYVAEGNIAAAIREFVRFRDLLEQELGVEPSQLMTDLLPRAYAISRYP